MPIRRAVFDLFLCLALVNLWFLRVWAQILPAVVNRANLYYLDTAPHWIHYPAVLASLVVLALAASAVVARGRRNPGGRSGLVARTVWLLLFGTACVSIWGQVPEDQRESVWRTLGTWGLGASVLAGLAVAAWLLRVHAARVVAAIEVFAIFASPFLFMTVGQALFAWAKWEPDRFAGRSLEPGLLAEPQAAKPAGRARVVWIVFDELDQHAAFDARPASVALPELDRMAGISFVAQNAFAPAGETRRSLASSLLGRQVTQALPSDERHLACTIGSGDASRDSEDCWTSEPSIFARLRARGLDSAVAGWYHPYCRALAGSLVECTWRGLPYWSSDRLADSFDQQWRELIKVIPIVRNWPGPGRRVRREHAESYRSILEAALEYVSDPDRDFVLVHLPVPHHPDIFDPTAGALSSDDPPSYFDNLVLADQALGALRGAMEAADLWDRSTVVVTSDHWWRAIHRGDWGLSPQEAAVWGEGESRRIPFLVKLAGPARPARFPRPFNTLLLHDLTLAIVDAEISTSSEVVAWLELTRGQVPIPYLEPHHVRRVGALRSPR